jgi:hypothetical protein
MNNFINRIRFWCALLCLATVLATTVGAHQNSEFVAKNEMEATEVLNTLKPLVLSNESFCKK